MSAQGACGWQSSEWHGSRSDVHHAVSLRTPLRFPEGMFRCTNYPPAEGHNLDDCQNKLKCVNCQGDHVAISRDCPKWKIEKDIVTLKYTEKISFADACKRLQPSFDPSKDSYATVTQTPLQSSRPLPPWAKKIRLPIDFKTEIEYLKYISNYCLTRLDTLDEITSENPVPRNAPSSDETPPPPLTTPVQKKWNHNPEYWVRSTIYSFKWWWKWNRNAYNEQQKNFQWG